MGKKNKLVYVLSFWLLLFFAIFSLFNNIRLYSNNFFIKGFGSIIEPISVNLTLKNNLKNPPLICFNDFCSSLDKFSYAPVYSVKFNKENKEFFNNKVTKLFITYPIDTKIDIHDISVFVGNKGYYFNDTEINNFKKFSAKIQINKKTDNYTLLEIPVKNNYKGIFNHIKISVLSLFYFGQFFLPMFVLQYLALFFAFLIYVFNREYFNIKLPKNLIYYLLVIVIAIGTFLRFNGITYFPLWTDEVYTKTIAIKNFMSCFKDAGNPPLFFIFEYIFAKIFGNSDFALRFLPCIFGIALIPVTFLLFKNDKKLAIFAAFLTSINTINIYHSQEARAYSLDMLLIAIGIYLLFRYLKNIKNKNLAYYTLILSLMINCNYYLVFFAISSFFWGVADLIQNKNKNEIKKFFFANFIAGLTFIPYLIISSKTALNNTFNTWIKPLSHDVLLYTINEYFINKYIFIFLSFILLLILIFSFFPKKILNKINLEKDLEKENLFIFLLYSITFVILSACIVSVFIKPIFHKRTLLGIYELFLLIQIISVWGIFKIKKYNKLMLSIKVFISLCLLFICMTITKPMPLREIYNEQNFMDFITWDSVRYSDKYDIQAIKSDTEEYIDNYPEAKKIDIKWHFLDTNSGKILSEIKKKDYIKNNKKTILYTTSIGVDTEKLLISHPLIRVYSTNAIPILKFIYE